MARFFINRPIVAMVISIIMVLVGSISMLMLPVAKFPKIVPPEIQLQTTFVGADALAVEQSVATPVEQQMSGVDNMNYMYSINSNDGKMSLRVNFDVNTDPNIDQVLAQMRLSQADSQLPEDVRRYGFTVVKSPTAPLLLFSLYSPNNTHDATFLANYAYINLNDKLLRVPGISQIRIFGAGQYAMRLWVKPDTLAKLNITVGDILEALQQQNTVNPAGQIGGEPAPRGQEFTYAVRAQGRLITAEEFGDIVIRANPDGSIVRMKDVSRPELGAQVYNIICRLNGKPAATIALYQLPGSDAIKAAKLVKQLMAEESKQFPPDLDYVNSLDTTTSITEGINDIIKTLYIALVLVLFVVFIFLQNWRATLIPMLAVPVSLVGTFAFFPLLGFSINTLSLFGLVLAIGLVVDDAIVVVEAVQHHIEEGLSPRDATIKAMDEVSSPVIAIALILAAVFIPTVFIPGITGRLYQQFAVTIAISVLISAFNALTLSPALSALLLKPRQEITRGPLGWFFIRFNRLFRRAVDGYTGMCRRLIRKAGVSLLFLAIIAGAAALLNTRLPGSFLPEEDQGYFYLIVSLPEAASLQRTYSVCRQVDEILKNTPGIKYYTNTAGFSLLSYVNLTNSGFYFVSLDDWDKRQRPETKLEAIMAHLNRELGKLPQARAFAFTPPAIPGVGTAGGVTFMLEDRAGRDVRFLADNTRIFMDAARKRPEIGMISTTLLADVPQILADVDRDKALRQGINIRQIYNTLQTFMGGMLVNYFNRFGRQWQVYVTAEGDYRSSAEKVGQFYVRNDRGDAVPLSSLVTMRQTVGPEFTMRYNLYRCAQINVSAKPGYSSAQVMRALEEVFRQTMPSEMGFDYYGMSFQEYKAQQGVPAAAVFALSLLFAFLILAAQYESWTLPLSVLLCTPIAVFGAFAALWIGRHENNIYAQIGLIMLIGLSAKNSILIVEFAKNRYRQGMSLLEAAIAGARLRLRPILMTSFAFIFGCLPLAIASGAGALTRQIMGITVIGGMLAASGIAIFFIPVTFTVVEAITERRSKKI